MFLAAAAAALLCACAGKAHYFEPSKDGGALVLRRPEAVRVEIVRSCTGFSPEPTQRGADGAWVFQLKDLNPFEYFYIVDGRPYTPPCAFKNQDGFGGETCIFVPEK